MGFSIGRLFGNLVHPTPAPAPSKPVGPQPAVAPAENAPSDVLSVSQAQRRVTVPSKAALTITVKAGDTYWGIARRFAAAKGQTPSGAEIRAYVKDLQAANGKDLKAGQTVKVPLTKHASYKLPSLIAAQLDIAARQKQGEKIPALDWAHAEAAWGYAESMTVTVKPLAGGQPQLLAIREYGPAKDGGTVFTAALVLPPLEEIRHVQVAKGDTLAVTAKKGDSAWTIARRFAASKNAPLAPSAAEVSAYAQDLVKLNGQDLKEGQTVRLPVTAHANPLLEAMIAAQHDWAARGEQGHDVPLLDWGAATAKWGYAESITIEVPGMGTVAGESLVVQDGSSSPNSTGYKVSFKDDFERANDL